MTHKMSLKAREAEIRKMERRIAYLQRQEELEGRQNQVSAQLRSKEFWTRHPKIRSGTHIAKQYGRSYGRLMGQGAKQLAHVSAVGFGEMRRKWFTKPKEEVKKSD